VSGLGELPVLPFSTLALILGQVNKERLSTTLSGADASGLSAREGEYSLCQSEEPPLPRVLAVVLNQTRGFSLVRSALRDVGFRHYETRFAFCGADVNDEAASFDYYWNFSEPDDWRLTLQQNMPRATFDFFFTSDSEFASRLSLNQELWTSGFIQMYFRDEAMKRILELGLDSEYEWIFFLRADYLFEQPIPGLTSLNDLDVISLDGDSYGGVNDRFLGFSAGVCIPIASAFRMASLDSEKGGQTLTDFLENQDSPNPEQALLFLLERESLLSRTALVPQHGYCVRGPTESPRWSMGFWSSKRGLFVKYPTELLATKINRVLGSLVSQVRPLAKSDRKPTFSSTAKLVRVAGTQPRLFLAPLLIVFGEAELAHAVFADGRRTKESLVLEILSDLRRLLDDFVWGVTGKKRFHNARL